MTNTQFPWLKTIPAAVMLASIMALTSLAAAARDNNRIVLDPGTVIPVTLNTELSSATANTGDTFTATVDASRDGYNRILNGATVTGYVKSVDRQSGDHPGMLDVAFTGLDLPDGTSYTISGEPISLGSKYVSTDRDGMLVAKSTGGNRAMKFAGIGAGAGALVGVLATGGLSLMDTIVGASLGFGASTINKPPSSDEYHDVDLKPGTQIGVVLGKRVTYYHRYIAPTSASTYGAPVQIGIEQDPVAEGLPLPSYRNPDSRGMTVLAANRDDVTISPGNQATITTGLRFAVPAGYEVQLRPIAMLGQEDNLTLVNSLTAIDSHNNGVVRVTLFNSGQSPVVIHRGDPIARLLVTQVVHAQFNQSSF